MNQNNSENEEYIEVEIVDSQPLSDSENFHQKYEETYPIPKSSNRGCYLTTGCLFVFLVGFVTFVGIILSFFKGVLTSLF